MPGPRSGKFCQSAELVSRILFSFAIGQASLTLSKRTTCSSRITTTPKHMYTVISLTAWHVS